MKVNLNSNNNSTRIIGEKLTSSKSLYTLFSNFWRLMCTSFWMRSRILGLGLINNSVLTNRLTAQFHTHRTWRRIRNIISNEHTRLLLHSVISSCLDYFNSLHINMSKANKIELVVKKCRRQPISRAFCQLHFLPVEYF